MVCHPSCDPGAVDGISVRVRRATRSLALLFRVEGRVDQISIPPPCAPARRDGLWRHTCVELFLRAGDPGYAEFNLSPSGAWSAYRFDAYRTGMRELELALAPTAEVRRGDGRLDVELRIARVPAPWGRAAALWIAASAVVEDTRGALAYWALAHPAGAPDFHHLAGFVPGPGAAEADAPADGAVRTRRP